MADLVDVLHTLSRQRGRGGATPLLGLHRVPSRPDEPISHLPVGQRLIEGWITLTGRSFRRHQSLALSAMRRGEAVALLGGGSSARQTLHLLTLELQRLEPHTTAIVLVPDQPTQALYLEELNRFGAAISRPGIALADRRREALTAPIVVVTPETLHERLLRHHDRAWTALWSRLRLLLIADADRYHGVAASHLTALLLRALRLAPTPPQLLAGVGPVADAEVALSQLCPQSWRLIPAGDSALPERHMALWRAGGERRQEAAALALGFQRAGARVHVVAGALDVSAVRELIGEMPAISVATGILPADVQIVVGASLGVSMLQQALDDETLVTVLLLADDPLDRALARIAVHEHALPLLNSTSTWIFPPQNAYVVAQHLLCAANERPLSAAEVQAWSFTSIVARLEERGELVRLPDPQPFWQPFPGGDDPYDGISPVAAGSPPALVHDPQSSAPIPLDPSLFDRWAFLGAALPPLRGGLRVHERNDAELSLQVRLDNEQRRTLPLRRCHVRVRDTRERRELAGCSIGWGRVLIDEEIYGYREVTAGNAPVERALSSVLHGSWSAPAVWIDLQTALKAPGQIAGWSLASALPLRCLARLEDLVPAYDAEARRMFLIDAQPGGSGLAIWLFAHLHELLPTAYDIALDARSDPLLEPVARVDMDWLLPLLSQHPPQSVVLPARTPQRETAPIRENPPPLRDERPATRDERPTRDVPPTRDERPAGRDVPPMRDVPPTRDERPPTRDERPPTRDERPPTRDERPATRDERPPTRDERPTRDVPPTRDERPTRDVPPLRDERPPTRDSVPKQAQTAAEPVEPEEDQPRLPLEAPAPPAKARGSARERKRKGSGSAPREATAGKGKKQPAASEPPAPAPRPTTGGNVVAPPEPATPAPPPEPILPDAAAMVERLRRLRKQRTPAAPAPAPPRAVAAPVGEPRFHTGDLIHCTPYGEGVVRSSRFEGDRELLVVAFLDHGELTIDAAVNAARLVESTTADEDAEPA